MITEKAAFAVTPTGAPPSYESVTNGRAQTVDEADKKEAWAPEADTRDPPYAQPYASTSAPPKPKEKALMSERECFESGGHVIPTILFRPGGIPAMIVTVAVALWNKKPILCERCQKELGEEDFKDIYERREGACKGKGTARRHWKDGSGSSAGRCGQRRERREQRRERREQRKEGHERPRCGRSRRNSF